MVLNYLNQLFGSTRVVFELQQLFGYIKKLYANITIYDHLVGVANCVLYLMAFYLARILYRFIKINKKKYHIVFMISFFVLLQIASYIIGSVLGMDYTAYLLQLLFPYFAIYTTANYLFHKHRKAFSKTVLRILKFNFYALFNWIFIALATVYFLPNSSIIKSGFIRLFVFGLFIIFAIGLLFLRKIILEAIKNKNNLVLQRVLKMFYSANWLLITLCLFIWLSQAPLIIKIERLILSIFAFVIFYFTKWGVKSFFRWKIKTSIYKIEWEKIYRFLHLFFRLTLSPLIVVLIFHIWDVNVRGFILDLIGPRTLRKLIYLTILFSSFRVLMILSSLLLRIYMQDKLKNHFIEQRFQTLLHILSIFFKLILGTIFLFFMLLVLGVNPSPVFANFWVLTGGLMLGLQTLLKDFAVGAFMMFEDTFHIGDSVEVIGMSGTVEEVTLRVLKIRDSRGLLISIPFNKVDVIANRSRQYVFAVFNLIVDVESDIEKVRKVMHKAAEEVAKLSEFKDIVLEPLEVTIPVSISSSGVVCEGKLKIKAMSPKPIRAAYYAACKRLFEQEQIKLSQDFSDFKNLFT